MTDKIETMLKSISTKAFKMDGFSDVNEYTIEFNLELTLSNKGKQKINKKPKIKINNFSCAICIRRYLIIQLKLENENHFEFKKLESLNKALKVGHVKISSNRDLYMRYCIPIESVEQNCLSMIIKSVLKILLMNCQTCLELPDNPICTECDLEVFECDCDNINEMLERELISVIQIIKKYPDIFDLSGPSYSEDSNIYVLERRNLFCSQLKSYSMTFDTFESFDSFLRRLAAKKLYLKRFPKKLLMCETKNQIIKNFYLAPWIKSTDEFESLFESELPIDQPSLEFFVKKNKRKIIEEFYKLVSSNLNKMVLKTEDFISLDKFAEPLRDDSRKLGEGGFATVYLNYLTHSNMQERVKCALKLPNNKKESNLMSSLRSEYEYCSLKEMNHPSITKVYGVFEFYENDDTNIRKIGLCMEYLEGQTLSKCAKNLSDQEKIEAMTQVAQGLCHLHAKGYVHQDIKPSNIIWQNGRAKIIDFGLATEEETLRENLGFSLEYADPNHLKKNSPGKPADVWSWAVTFVSIFMNLEPYKNVIDRSVLRSEKKPGGNEKIQLIERIYTEIEVNMKRPLIDQLTPKLGTLITELLKNCMNSKFMNRPKMSEIVTILTR